MSLRLAYDADANAAYIYVKDALAPGEVIRSEVCDVDIKETAIVLQFDAEDRLVGIEILGARKLLPREVLGDDTPRT